MKHLCKFSNLNGNASVVILEIIVEEATVEIVEAVAKEVRKEEALVTRKRVAKEMISTFCTVHGRT